MNFAIRRTCGHDAPHLPQIERSAGRLFRSVPDLAWIADDSDLPVKRHLDFIAAGTSWVVEAGDGRLVGFLCAEAAGDALHIWELSVAGDYQRQGLGRALMEVAISFARRRSLTWVTLTTFRSIPWNEPAYRKMGFATLQPDELDRRLGDILDREASAGLPKARRCAMRMLLSVGGGA